jgi:hypothetical protein
LSSTETSTATETSSTTTATIGCAAEGAASSHDPRAAWSRSRLRTGLRPAQQIGTNP